MSLAKNHSELEPCLRVPCSVNSEFEDRTRLDRASRLQKFCDSEMPEIEFALRKFEEFHLVTKKKQLEASLKSTYLAFSGFPVFQGYPHFNPFQSSSIQCGAPQL